MGTNTSKEVGRNPQATSVSLKVFDGHAGAITSLRTTDKHLFSASRDGTVKMWSLKGGSLVREFVGHTFWIECIDVVDNWLFTGSTDATARAWNVKDGVCVAQYKGHKSDVTCIQVVGAVLYTGSTDGTIKEWMVETAEVIKEYRGHTHSISFLKVVNGVLYSASYDKTLRTWKEHSQTGECNQIFEGHTDVILCVELDTANDRIYTGSADTTAISWCISSGSIVNTFKGHHEDITCIKVINGQLFTGSKDSTVRRWHADDCELLTVYRGHLGAVKCFEISDKFLFTGGSDHVVKAWYIESGECIRTFKGHTNAVTCLVVLPNNLLVSGSDDKKILVWGTNFKDFAKLRHNNSQSDGSSTPQYERKWRSLPNSPISSPMPSARNIHNSANEYSRLRPVSRDTGRELHAKARAASFGDTPLPLFRKESDEALQSGRTTPTPTAVADPGISAPHTMGIFINGEEDGMQEVDRVLRDATPEETRKLVPSLPAIQRLNSGFSRPRSNSLVEYNRLPKVNPETTKKIEVLRPIKGTEATSNSITNKSSPPKS